MSSSRLLARGEGELRQPPPLPPRSTALPQQRGGDSAAMPGEVRPLEAGDIPAVAALFQKSFRRPRDVSPESLRRYLMELFLRHPLADAQMPSRVHVAARGTINGFIGILPARMRFQERPIRAAIAGSLMVDDPARDPLAGARLMRAFFKGPQDLSFSESANAVSQNMWERLGGFAAPAYSMEWVRVLRPFAASLALLARVAPPAGLLRPLGRGLDYVASPLTRRLLALGSATAAGVDATDEAMLRAVPEFAAAFTLRPEWSDDILRWTLAHALRKERHGPLVQRMVTARSGRPLGCYFYYARPGGIAWVLDVLARPQAAGAVVDDLFAHASAQGCCAVRGRTQPHLLDALLRRRCLLLHRASTVVHAREPVLMQAIRSGDALLNGLAGEAWTRLIGGEFA